MSMNLHQREDLIFTLLETADQAERRLDRTLSNTRAAQRPTGNLTPKRWTISG